LKPLISSSVNWAHCRICEYWPKCGCCLEKWSSWNWTNHTGGYGPVYPTNSEL